MVLDHTSFYADSGGQVGDIGWLYSDDHNTVVADVSGVPKPVQGVFAHKVMLEQTIAVGDMVDTVVDADHRDATGATIPARTCCMRRCARCWARM